MRYTVYLDGSNDFGLTARRGSFWDTWEPLTRAAVLVTPTPDGAGCVLTCRMQTARREGREFFDYVAGESASGTLVARQADPRDTRHRRKEQQTWRDEHWPHRAAVEQAVRETGHRSRDSFYEEDERRLGDDVPVGDLIDSELQWTIRWLPSTMEVVAFAVGWIDERWHTAFHLTDADPAGFRAGIDLPPVPELVLVLGREWSAEAAQECIASATSLQTIRAALT